jgi:hypothetical protein
MGYLFYPCGYALDANALLLKETPVPIYVFECPSGPHRFEKILPMKDVDLKQECPTHHLDCQMIAATPSPFQWGQEDIHWAAGLKSKGVM